MADIAKSGTPSISTAVPPPNVSLSGLISNDTIAAGDACYIKSSDGMVYRSTGAAANAAAVVDGFAAQAASAGQSITLYWHVNFNYGASLTPGTSLYLSGATAGALADAASTGGTVVVGRIIDATRIWVRKSY